MPKVKPVRERAARALCKLEGLEPNITMEGRPCGARSYRKSMPF